MRLPYEGRLSKLKLQTLEYRRETGCLIATGRASNKMEIVDRGDTFMWDFSPTRGHGKRLKMANCQRYIKRFSYLQLSIEL